MIRLISRCIAAVYSAVTNSILENSVSAVNVLCLMVQVRASVSDTLWGQVIMFVRNTIHAVKPTFDRHTVCATRIL